MSTINLKTQSKRIAYMKKDMITTSSVIYSRISTDDLLKFACINSGIPRAQMASAFYALEHEIEQFIFNGHSLEFGQLGTFFLALNAHAAETEDDAGAQAVYRKALRFRQSKRMKNLINSNVTFDTIKKTVDQNDETEETDTQSGGNTDNGHLTPDPSEGGENGSGTDNGGSTNNGGGETPDPENPGGDNGGNSGNGDDEN